MNLLVTGASGAVAQSVIADLAQDHRLVLCSRRHPSAVGHTVPAGATFLHADLTNSEDCQRVVAGVDAVVHIGANSWHGPDTFRTNTLSTYYLLEAMRQAGIRRMVFASSNCALGHCSSIGTRFVPERVPIDETQRSRCEDEYGLSKLVNEETLATFARGHGIESYALRLAGCWGPDEYTWHAEHRFDAAAYAQSFWAYVDMRDVAQAFRKALHAPPMAQAACVPLYINAADTTAEQPSAALLQRFYPELGEQALTVPEYTSVFSWHAAQTEINYQPQYSWREFHVL